MTHRIYATACELPFRCGVYNNGRVDFCGPCFATRTHTSQRDGLASTESEQSPEVVPRSTTYSTPTSATGDDATPARTLTLTLGEVGTLLAIGVVAGLLAALIAVNAGLALGALP